MADEPKPTQTQADQTSIKDLETKLIDKTARLEATVASLTQQLNESLTGMNKFIANVAEKQVNGGNDGSDDSTPTIENDDTWYENFQAAPKKETEKLIDHKLRTTEGRVKETVRAEIRAQDEVKKYDDLAYKNFPQLQDKEHVLRRETEAILANDPNLQARTSGIYDAARMAYANLVHRGELVPDSFKEEAKRLLSISDAEMHPFRSGNPKKEGELTKSQAWFATRMGIKPEKYLARLSTLGKQGKDTD